MQQKFGRTSPELARMQSLMPREMADTLATFVRTGNAENQQAFIQTFAQQMRGLQGSPLMQTMALLATGSSLEGPIAALVNMMTQLQASGNLTAEQQADLERLRERGRVMDEASRAIGTAQEAVTRVLGMISAQINKLVTENVLDRFKGTIESIGTAVESVSNAASGEGFRAFANAIGAGAAGTRIAAAFDTGILAGIGETLKTILMAPINYFMERFDKWRVDFLQGLRDLLPSWLTRSAPTVAPAGTEMTDPMTGFSIGQVPSATPRTVVPVVPAEAVRNVVVPPAPAITSGQADVLTAEQFQALRVRENEVGRLVGELLNNNRRNQEQNARLIELQEQQAQYLDRMERAQVRTANATERQ
jgi:hypothetical protein